MLTENVNKSSQNENTKGKLPALVELNQRFQKCYGMSDDYLMEIERKTREILQYDSQIKESGPSVKTDPNSALEDMLLRVEEWEDINKRLHRIMVHLKEII